MSQRGKSAKLAHREATPTSQNGTSPSNVTQKWIPAQKDSQELMQFQSEWGTLQQEDISSADYYFNSYAHFGIHEEMLKDSVRTGAYQRAIMQNRHLFEGKTVLDVGSGTGILCMFAAKPGAAKVYGIECSEIIHIARKVVKANNLDDKIEFIQGKAEEVALPVDKVDIIISEWMGYFLLYESMLDTVIYCRDKWLVPGGLIFPDKASLHIAAIEDGEYKEEKIGFWQNVYGFEYSVIQRTVMEEPIVDTVKDDCVATSSSCILELDLTTCTVSDLDFAAPFKIQLKRKDFLHAFIAWFDISFSCCHKPVTFTTGPFGRYTHWKQTVFYMEDNLVCHKGETVQGMIAVRKNKKNPRDLDIKILYNFDGQVSKANRTQFYRLR